MIPWAKPNYWGNERKYAIDAIDSLWLSDGQYLKMLENNFYDIFNEYIITTSNGTSALQLIYQTLKLKKNDEIIVPGFCFLASANIAKQFDITPVFCEVNKDTWCMDPNDIENKITLNTKAIVVVHSYGNICEMDDILTIAKKRNIIVIEDCAESIFSKYNNQYCGTFGDFGSFSFQSTKTITTGEGGMVICKDKNFYDYMMLMRNHGLSERGKYNHKIAGNNFRLTNIQAAIGVGQLEQIEKIKIERNRVYTTYLKYLADDGIAFQKINKNITPIMWAVAVKIDNKIYRNRNEIMSKLKEFGIETRPGFVSSSLLNIYNKHKLPICEDLSNNIISLPSFATLTEEEIFNICEKFKLLKK